MNRWIFSLGLIGIVCLLLLASCTRFSSSNAQQSDLEVRDVVVPENITSAAQVPVGSGVNLSSPNCPSHPQSWDYCEYRFQDANCNGKVDCSCIESDGGNDPYRSGWAVVRNGYNLSNKSDGCDTMHQTLYELFCDPVSAGDGSGAIMAFAQYNCSAFGNDVCLDGACIPLTNLSGCHDWDQDNYTNCQGDCDDLNERYSPGHMDAYCAGYSGYHQWIDHNCTAAVHCRCADADKDDPLTPGGITLTDRNLQQTYPDQCVNLSGTVFLREYICKPPRYVNASAYSDYTQYYCPNYNKTCKTDSQGRAYCG
jgi:hypothetical protein